MAAGGIRVLLVEDHPVYHEVLASLLDEYDDIEVIGWARTGQEAIDLAAERKPDVILMDQSLPDMSGSRAATKIISASPAVRIVGLSAYAGKEVEEEIFEAGMSAYIRKDSDIEIVLAAIRNSSNVRPIPPSQESLSAP